MGTTDFAFDSPDWTYSRRKTSPKRAPSAPNNVCTFVVGSSLAQDDQPCTKGGTTICVRNKCFSGYLVALPLSLLAWAGLIMLIVYVLPN